MSFAECEKNVQAPDAGTSVTAYVGKFKSEVCVKYAFANHPDKVWPGPDDKDRSKCGSIREVSCEGLSKVSSSNMEGLFFNPDHEYCTTEPLGYETNTKLADANGIV